MNTTILTQCHCCTFLVSLQFALKLDGVAPLITDPPLTDYIKPVHNLELDKADIPVQDLEGDKGIITQTRFRMG